MVKILEILVPLILIVVLLACILNDGDGFHVSANYSENKNLCSGFTVGGLYEGFYAGETSGKKAKVTMVRADWCHFCQQAKPEYDKFVGDYRGKILLGYKMDFQDLEESKDKDIIATKYKVKGYPTYFVEIDDKLKSFYDQLHPN